MSDMDLSDGSSGTISAARSAPLPPPVPVREVKQPHVALLLGIVFPGLGQIYNGQIAKALVVFFGVFGSIYAIIESGPLPFVFFIPFSYLFGVVDAYLSAIKINAAAAGRADLEEDPAESPAWGATLVGLGLLLLLNNLGWLRLAEFQRFWPALLVVAGVLFVRGSLQRRKA